MSFTGVDDLLGVWRLESAGEVFDDGEGRDEFGRNPEASQRHRRRADARPRSAGPPDVP